MREFAFELDVWIKVGIWVETTKAHEDVAEIFCLINF